MMHASTISSPAAVMPSEKSRTGFWRLFANGERLLVLLFILTLPLVNPWVRGDGVGYYAYARSLLIERHLNFEKDWQHGNESFTMGRVGTDGAVLASQYTATGHIANLWTIGPSLLWAPFLLVTHLGVLACDRLGGHIAADGFSSPYLVTVAVTTSLYGFLGLLLSFRLARTYFEERWAFLATLGIWWASSLPVYMYFNPSYSHAHSAFAVALFLWYWHRTRGSKTPVQWVLLGIISGLMVNVYYPNGVLLLIPLLEAIGCYWRAWRSERHGGTAIPRLILLHALYVSIFLVALLPTLISRKVIFGSPLQTGYMPASTWMWNSPEFWNVLFSADHGMLIWTPILVLSLLGIVLFRRTDKTFATSLIVVFLAFYSVIAFYPNWDGMSSFGNRFFISLTPLFILGIAAFFQWVSRSLGERRAMLSVSSAVAIFVIWNLAFIFQWGTHLVPARGPISWKQMAYNQVAVVPKRAVTEVTQYLENRRGMMKQIEVEDLEQQKEQMKAGTTGTGVAK